MTQDSPHTSRPLHVLHVITSLDVGGAERMLVKLVAALRGRFRFTVVSLKGDGPLAADLRAAGAEVVPLAMRGGRDLPAAVWRVAGLIRRLKPDSVQTWLYHADLVGTVAVRLSGLAVPLVWNVRCSDMDLTQYSRSTAAIVRVLAWMSRGMDLITVNSESGLRLHEALGYRPKAWRVMPNGFDTALYRPDPEAGQLVRQTLGLPGTVPVVGAVNRYDRMKDQPTFLSAAAIVAARRPDVRFVLAGRGVEASTPELGQHPALREYGDRIHLLGERRDVPAIMAALDVFVLSSAFGEGFPNVVGEAMACGVRCVVTDVGAAAMLVGETGRVVPRRDPEALAAAIEAMLDQPEAERRNNEQAARRRIVDTYGLERVADLYAAVFSG